MDKKLTILLADDHKIVRDGLAALINAEQDMKVVAECETGNEALEKAVHLKPNIIVMDIAMPGMNGVEACRRIAARHLRVKIIALSVHNDRQYVTRMLGVGASGYLSKDCAFDELVKAIRAVVGGGIYLSPQIAGDFVKDSLARLPHSEVSVGALLSAREREVLQLVAEGQSTKEIAFALKVSVKTIESFRLKLMSKLNLHSVAALTKYAVREGLTSLDAPAPKGK